MLSLVGCLKLESDIDQEELCVITHDSFVLIFYDLSSFGGHIMG